MKKSLTPFLLAAVLIALSSPAFADYFVWEQDADESQVNNCACSDDGSTGSGGSGHSVITYDGTTDQLCWNLNWALTDGELTALHVHAPADASMSAMPAAWHIYTGEQDVIDAGVNRTADSISSCVDFTELVNETGTGGNTPEIGLAHMVNEMAYLNIHSTAWMAGEIRANLVLTEASFDQTKAQQKCTNAMLSNLSKVAATRAKHLGSCIKDASKGKLDDAGDCAGADGKGKIGKAEDKLGDAYAKFCTGTDKDGEDQFPGFGLTFAAPGAVETAAAVKEETIFAGIYGSDLDLAIIAEDDDKDGGKCQQAVAKAIGKCQSAYLKDYNGCVKAGLAGKGGTFGAFDQVEDFRACYGADPKGKAAKACYEAETGSGAIVDVLAKKCAGVSLDTAFPGCGLSDVEPTAACINHAIFSAGHHAVETVAGDIHTCVR